MVGWYCSRDVLLFSALVTLECANVGLNTLFKAATIGGMSYHVFIVYAHAVAALALLPSPFLSHRIRVLPPLNISILSKIGLLGIIGCLLQNMGYKGINYSSPTLASALSNLVPPFTFILAAIFRMEKLAMKSTSSQAKISGTILSISGAFVVTLYRGPPIVIAPSKSIPLHQPPLLLHSSNSNWVIGGIFLSAEYLSCPIWYIVLAQIMEEYPDELTVIFFHNLCVAILAAIVGIVMEPNLCGWKVGLNIALISILCSGLVGSFVNNVVHTWALHVKGPVYVAMFKPLSIPIAVLMGVMFLGDTLYLGSVVGAAIISIGFYTVMWGKAKEETGEECEDDSFTSSSIQKVPLLQSYKNEEV